MSQQHVASESAPLLGDDRSQRETPRGIGVANAGIPRQYLAHCTLASMIMGALTVVLLVASMIVMMNRPEDYYPPFELYYYFAPTAGWVSLSHCEQHAAGHGLMNLQSIIAVMHSSITWVSIKLATPSSQSLTGIIVDALASSYLLFQSLYGMQQFMLRGRSPSRVCQPTRPGNSTGCADWAKRAEPLFWTYLVATFLFA